MSLSGIIAPLVSLLTKKKYRDVGRKFADHPDNAIIRVVVRYKILVEVT